MMIGKIKRNYLEKIPFLCHFNIHKSLVDSF